MKISHKNIGRLAPDESYKGTFRISFQSVTTRTESGEVLILDKPRLLDYNVHCGECGGNVMMILAKVYVEDNGYFFLWWMIHPKRMKAYHERLSKWLEAYENPDPDTVLEIRTLSIKICRHRRKRHRKHHGKHCHPKKE